MAYYDTSIQDMPLKDISGLIRPKWPHMALSNTGKHSNVVRSICTPSENVNLPFDKVPPNQDDNGDN